MTQPDISKIQDELSTLLGTDATVDLLMHRQLNGGARESRSISLLDLSYRVEHKNEVRVGVGEINSGHMRTIRQTALLLEQDDFDLPQFTLRPKVKGLAGKLFNMLGNMSIEFDDSPEFTSAYSVVGWVEPTVREFIVKPIRDHFAKDHKWTVCGHGKKLVIYRKGKVIKKADHDAFIKQALPILSLFRLGEEALDARPDLRRETRPEDVTASAERIGGVVGAAMSKQLDAIRITRSQLDEFAGSSVPRSIPPGMARQVIGQLKPAIIAAIVATLVGTVFGALCIMLGEGYDRWIAIPCFVGACIGLVGTYLLSRYRSSKTRVLRDGVLHEGAITDIKRTKTKVNNQRRHLVTLQNDKTSAVCRAYGTGAQQAKMFQESGERVRFLVDPIDAENVVCLELLTIFEG